MKHLLLAAGLGLDLLVLAAWGSTTSHAIQAPTASTATDDALGYVYVCNQSSATVSVIDMETLEVVATVDLLLLGFDKNAKPHHIAVEPDGSYWYVSLIGANRVLKVDRDNRLVAQAEFEAPGMLALHPDRDLLFVGRSMMAVNPPQRIGVIDRSDMTIEEVDVFFPRPHALTIDPRGDYVYSGSLAVNQFLSMHIDTGEIHLVTIDGETHTLVQFAMTPDGRTLVVTGQLTGQLLVFDTTDPADIKRVDAIEVNAQPWHPMFTPDGRFVYFGNKMANTVTAVDIEKREIAAVIEGKGLAMPHGIAISPDGKRVFISNNNLGAGGMKMDQGAGHNMEQEEPQPGTLVVIDTATNTIEKVIKLGFYPSGAGARMLVEQ